MRSSDRDCLDDHCQCDDRQGLQCRGALGFPAAIASSRRPGFGKNLLERRSLSDRESLYVASSNARVDLDLEKIFKNFTPSHSGRTPANRSIRLSILALVRPTARGLQHFLKSARFPVGESIPEIPISAPAPPSSAWQKLLGVNLAIPFPTKTYSLPMQLPAVNLQVRQRSTVNGGSRVHTAHVKPITSDRRSPQGAPNIFSKAFGGSHCDRNPSVATRYLPL